MLFEKKILIYGLIISIGYSVASIQGFFICFVGELFRVSIIGSSLSKSKGLVVNLFRNEVGDLVIGGLLLNTVLSSRISCGSKVSGLSKLLRILLGDFSLSSIIHPLASYVWNSCTIDVHYAWLIESPAPRIIYRQSVFEPLQTGLLVIDSIIPIGRGQRELIVGDRGLGKTSIGLDTILNQKHEKVFCVYSAIGQKATSILDVFQALVRFDAVFYLSIVVSSSSS